MDKYLLQILLDVNTIIIPGLGALTVTNAKTGEMMFMSYLKYDDGKLSAYISEKEGMSENDAKNLIAKYVREIHAKLDQGHTYDMFKFGRFLKNKDGDVDFESWGTYASIGEDIISDEAPATEAVEESAPAIGEIPVAETTALGAEDPVVEEITIPVAEEFTPEENPIVTAEKPEEDAFVSEITSTPEFNETAADEETEEQDDVIEDLTVMPAHTHASSLDEILEKSEEQPVEEEVPVVVEETVKPDPIADQTQDESRVQVENIYIPPSETTVETTVVEEKPAPDLSKKKPAPAPKQKKKRGVGFWIVIVLIVLLVGGGTTTLLFYDQVKQYLPFLESKRAEAEQAKDTVSAEELNENAAALEAAENERIANENNPEVPTETTTAPVEEQPAAEVSAPEPPAVSNDGSKPYHVIAGAFASKENADRFAAKQNGTVLGEFGGMYLVSSGSYASKSEAQAGISGKGWVFKLK